ncbi:MAG: ATP-binding cassette domain-containing protein [Roseomonas sp.]|nr:ATP-binding cassette domain-containing protein [Roseomonas sp.]MCA3328084.1 ATP-binding cassette domain-containing protein [Roseomonas sp.]MCA3329517.1 ATP-binding cassette domain-containing protein [Roseomonas sp.]MCA3333481.1 ATP-binding cassette domain-containing protein [Roseomonas sp.]MCA3346539.1 ATP-binding cassette domain-containing protein [Roseomonas sp.]
MNQSAPTLLLQDVIIRHQAPGGAPGFELVIEEFSIARGEALALAGPSGAGKSTLLDLLALARRPSKARHFLLTPFAGKVIDLGAVWQAGDDNSLTAIRALHFGYILQTGGLLPFLSIRRNIALSQAVLGQSDPAHIEALAARLEISHLLERMPATLSVGQRQRVAIARALAHRPAILLADEPTASVHPALADTILALLIEQAREQDTALVLATHDPDRAARHGFTILPLRTEAGAAGAGRSWLNRAWAPA